MISDTPTEPNDAAREGGDPGAAPQTPDEVMRAASARIAELETEAQDYKDRWMRAEAENANVRARAKREADEARQYAVQKFATDMVEAAENLRRGLDSIPPHAPGEPEVVAKLRDGFASIERSFTATLERHGVRREDPTGASFDPNLHQAMAEQESEEHPAGTVLKAWTNAWTLNGRLLRPAMVVVAKAPPSELTGPGGGAHAMRLDTTA
jgi:molecular chaperone GrpE